MGKKYKITGKYVVNKSDILEVNREEIESDTSEESEEGEEDETETSEEETTTQDEDEEEEEDSDEDALETAGGDLLEFLLTLFEWNILDKFFCHLSQKIPVLLVGKVTHAKLISTFGKFNYAAPGQ